MIFLSQTAAFGASLAGFLLIVTILWDAFETILVPRRVSRKIRLTRMFYLLSWRTWRSLARRIPKLSPRETILGFFAPLSLILLLALWATVLIFAFSLLQWSAAQWLDGTPHRTWGDLFYMSGETFFTLGYGDITPGSGLGRIFSVIEAGLGFAFLGTVIGYLPTMYSGFSQREIEITLMDARAGSPPTAAEFLARMSVCEESGLPDEILKDWERWAGQVLETHISYPLLAYYRSQHSNQNWLAALTMILDASALVIAGVDGIETGQARLTFAMARHALVDVTQIFVREYRPFSRNRLPDEHLALIRTRLQGTTLHLADTPEFHNRLTGLRLKYEPYAEALANFLLVELPPWIHEDPRKDNWKGGPWDKMIGSQVDVFRADEHF